MLFVCLFFNYPSYLQIYNLITHRQDLKMFFKTTDLVNSKQLYKYKQRRHLGQSKSFKTHSSGASESSLKGEESSFYFSKIYISRILPPLLLSNLYPLDFWVLFNCSSGKVGEAEFPHSTFAPGFGESAPDLRRMLLLCLHLPWYSSNGP